MHDNAVKIKIKAPPVDGEANAALIKFLSEVTGLAQKKISVVHGHTSKNKLIELETQLSADEILQKLLTYPLP